MTASGAAMLMSPAPSAPAGGAPSPAKPRSGDGKADASGTSFDRMLDEGSAKPSTPSTPRAGETVAPEAGATSAQPETATRDAREDAAAPAGLPDQLLSLLASLPQALTATAAATPELAATAAAAAGINAAANGSARTPASATALQFPLAAAAPPTAAPDPAALALAALGDAPARDSGVDAFAAAGEATAAIDGVNPAASFSTALSTARTESAPVLPTPLAQPANAQAGYDDAFGDNIVWMADQRLGRADIRVSPDHLGTIDVRLQLDGAKVTAEFFSAQPEVRQALEASFNRLRDMMGQHGLQLAHADVGQQRSGQGSGTDAPNAARMDEGDADTARATVTPLRSRRLLDEYA